MSTFPGVLELLHKRISHLLLVVRREARRGRWKEDVGGAACAVQAEVRAAAAARCVSHRHHPFLNQLRSIRDYSISSNHSVATFHTSVPAHISPNRIRATQPTIETEQQDEIETHVSPAGPPSASCVRTTRRSRRNSCWKTNSASRPRRRPPRRSSQTCSCSPMCTPQRWAIE